VVVDCTVAFGKRAVARNCLAAGVLRAASSMGVGSGLKRLTLFSGSKEAAGPTFTVN